MLAVIAKYCKVKVSYLPIPRFSALCASLIWLLLLPYLTPDSSLNASQKTDPIYVNRLPSSLSARMAQQDCAAEAPVSACMCPSELTPKAVAATPRLSSENHYENHEDDDVLYQQRWDCPNLPPSTVMEWASSVDTEPSYGC